MKQIVRAISIRQPFVEQILTGKKKREFRSRKTKIRERVWLYASKTPADETIWQGTEMIPGDLPAGVIVGSVEIVGCEYNARTRNYEYVLQKPQRVKQHKRAKNKAQPCFWLPKFR